MLINHVQNQIDFGLTDGRQEEEVVAAANIAIDKRSIPQASDDEIEIEKDFDYNGFQLVRSEFFAHLREPTITFNQGKISINSACLKKLPEVDFAQILINRQTKSLAIRPCQESEIFAFQWCSYRLKDGKRQPRQITCRLFFMKLCAMMGWNPDYRYKLLGKLIRANDEHLFLFDLTATETFVREKGDVNKKPRYSRTPLYPAEWQDQFGIPFEDHQKALKVNLFQGYAIYGVKDNTGMAPEAASYPAEEKLSTQREGEPEEVLPNG